VSERVCVVFHSTTKNRASRVVECTTDSSKALTETARLNRNAFMGGFYTVHRAATVRMWRDRGDPGSWSLAGTRRRRRR